MGVNSLPKIVTRQRRGCDSNPGPSATESSTLTTRLPSHPEYCLCTEKRPSHVYTLIHDMYSKHVLSVVVLSLTPLNDLLMTSPETRASSRYLQILRRFALLSSVTRQLQTPRSLQIHWPFVPLRRLTGTEYHACRTVWTPGNRLTIVLRGALRRPVGGAI